jgi:hypothetical protein
MAARSFEDIYFTNHPFDTNEISLTPNSCYDICDFAKIEVYGPQLALAINHLFPGITNLNLHKNGCAYHEIKASTNDSFLKENDILELSFEEISPSRLIHIIIVIKKIIQQ